MRSVAQAVREKYFDEDDHCLETGFVLYTPRVARRRLPSVLVLDHCDIDSVGDEHSLGSECSDVKELDLSHNQISKWDEVDKLTNCLRNLKFLNLSYNALGQKPISVTPVSFQSLKQLVLNGIGIQWKDLAPCLQFALCLEELHLSFNQMETPPLETCTENSFVFPNVTTLHYDGNRVENKDHLQWVSHTFPHLCTLVLCECPLWTFRWNSSVPRKAERMAKSVASSGYCSLDDSSCSECSGDGQGSACCLPPEDGQQATCAAVLFPVLRSVSLNHCHIDCWQELDELRMWPSLKELRLQSCPLFRKLDGIDRRQFIIARLPNIHRLNGGSNIDTKEREEAERNFVRRFKDCSYKPRRYEELVLQHGQVQPFAKVSMKPQRYVDVWFRVGERRWQDRVCVYLTLKELKERTSSATGLIASKLRFFHTNGSLPDEMRIASKQLYSYNVQDGDEFIIIEKI